MSGTHHPGSQASWGPKPPVATMLKMPPAGAALNTVNLSAVSATLAATGAGASPAYSSAPSPLTQDSSTRSSPCNISRTGSGASDASHPHTASTSTVTTTATTPTREPPATAASPPADLTAETLQKLSRQASQPGSAGGSTSGDQPGTPLLPADRSDLGPSSGEAPLGLEATLQGLALSGTTSPAGPAPLNFQAPPSSAVPLYPPVEVYARFPQEPTSFKRSTGQQQGRSGGDSMHSISHTAMVAAAAPPPYATTAAGSLGGYGPPGAMGPPLQHQAPPPFYVGSPPGGYGMAVYPQGGPPPPTSAGYSAATYYAQPGQQVLPGQHPGYAPMPLPHQVAYYGQPYQQGYAPQPPPYGAYGQPPPAGMGGGHPPSKGAAAAYAAEAEYVRQCAMMSYMQGFGMMVSPTGSPERTGRRSFQPNYWRNSSQDGQDCRDRLGPRPTRSRLSLDMSACKSENGDAHWLDPELVPLVAEDFSEQCSELLDEFKMARETGGPGCGQWTLKDMRGHMYPFCRDQHGSRLVQQQLETAAPEDLKAVFSEVRHKLLPLIVDVFGNYVVQRFLERGGLEVQAAVAEVVRGKALSLSLQMYGCRVIQKSLEVMPQEDKVAICQELTEHTLRCVRDQNGNHVIQKCIECVQPSDPARAMIETIVSKGHSLSTHTFGCRLVQRVLEHCSCADLRDRVVADVLESVVQLSHDQYGNYVVQHLVSQGPPHARNTIVAQVSPQVMTLALHKYASNVVEACLKNGEQPHRDAIVNQIIADGRERPSALTSLMRDQYGNYVVQRCLEVATAGQRGQLLEIIRPHLEGMRSFTYGKHTAAKAEALLAAQPQAEAAAPQLAEVDGQAEGQADGGGEAAQAAGPTAVGNGTPAGGPQAQAGTKGEAASPVVAGPQSPGPVAVSLPASA
ncbi:hypothetical protein D9Q98_009968 [Chlorella vulgaris]|uniref:PUM-HD domain-containing protein n=1 Tax=Chlorella vulgaris TaxID=3077 RepID=A0A9D4TFV7_CHLVU|nr:hypothetical protein D9Q98_009968 [Chlorella vulgaris]